MAYFKIGNTDFSSLVAKGGLKVDYETLVADTSGRNAQGDMPVDIINHKYKVSVNFIPMTPSQVSTLMSAIDNYVVTIYFQNPKTNSLTQITAYTSTPSISWNTLATGIEQTAPFSINFIQL